MSKLLTEGTYLGYPLGGGHFGAPGAPPGVPKCARGLGKNAEIPKKYIRIVHVEKYPKL